MSWKILLITIWNKTVDFDLNNYKLDGNDLIIVLGNKDEQFIEKIKKRIKETS